MGRYLSVKAGTVWKEIPEVEGNISVAVVKANGDVVWQPIKQVDVYTGSTWQTVWKVVPPHGGGGTHPPTSHTATVTAHVSKNTASWSIPSGRHVTHQVLTYYTGIHGSPAYHKHTVTVTPSARSHSVLAGTGLATVRYTYH